MQLKQVAEFAGVEKKEVIEEIENRREDFTAQGFKIAKKLNAGSSIAEGLAAQIVAIFDERRQQSEQAEQEAEERRRREEEERRRAAEELERKRQEELRRKEAEERRRKADEELARKRAEKERQQQAPPQQQPPAAAQHPRPPAQQAPPSATTPAAGEAPRPAGMQPPQAQADTDAPQHPGATRGSLGRSQASPEARDATKESGKQTPAAQKTGAEQKAKQEKPQAPSAKKEKPSGTKSPAGGADIKGFIDAGIPTKIEDDYRKRRKATKPQTEKARERPAETEGKPKPRRGKPQPETTGRKRIRPSQIFGAADSITDRRVQAKKKSGGQKSSGRSYRGDKRPQRPKKVRMVGDFTVGEFANALGVPANEIMKRLLMMGEMLTINHILEPEKAEELALEMDVEVEIERESDDADIAKYINDEDPEEKLEPRPPVVTIMGHVDHGKTTLLDRIRKADVAEHEYGGITQHIGAYQVQTPSGPVVFLDTPGHEAFTAMRSRGANVTDLVILVVAANDGVMPQTVEAINHAKAAGVPILVAINKVDVDGANPERIKQELMKYEMVPEDYGGEIITIPVSAISGKGVEELMEYLALQTEMLELRANPERSAEGAIVESHIDPQRGATATVLVERGTLNVGDIFLCGTEWGRVRTMTDDRGKELEKAGPATPVEILGLRGSPEAGEKFVVMPSEAEAREIAERRDERRRKRSQAVKPHLSLDNLADHMRDDEVLPLNLVIKADVQGSAEAIAGSLYKIKSDKVAIRIIHSAVGQVTSSDVRLADASDAIIIGFNVSIAPQARSLAEEENVDIRTYQVIYALIEDVEKAMLGMLKPEYEEKEEARAVVKATFRVSKVGTVAGCFVEEGTVGINQHARLVRNGSIIWRGKLQSLRRVKDDVKQVQSGLECGIGLEGFNDVKEGDVIETYSLVQREVTLVSSQSDRGEA